MQGISRLFIALAICLWALPWARANEIVEDASYHGAKTTVSYALWGGADEVAESRKICADFVKLHPEIRLDVSVYPWGQYWAKLQTQLAAGLAPDVLSFYSGSFGVWVARGALLPLDNLVAEEHLNLKDYQPAAVENCTWNKRLYCMPLEIAIWSLVYSKDRFEESGIPRAEWPRPDRAMGWEEFKKLAQRLTLRHPDGTFAQYGMSAGQNWDNVMLGMYGGTLVDRQVNPTRSTVAGNEPLAKAFIQLFQDQYGRRATLGQAPIRAGAFTASQDTLLLSPRFAMGTTGPWALKELRDGKGRFGVTPFPRAQGSHDMISVNSVGIAATCKHVHEAFLFMKYMASEPVERIYGARLKGVPALLRARDSFLNNDFGIGDCQAFLTDLDNARPEITSDIPDILNSRNNWIDAIELRLNDDYDAKLAALKKTNPTIDNARYERFTDAQNAAIEREVRAALPKLDQQISEAIRAAHLPPPSFAARVTYPAVSALLLAAAIFLYLRTVSNSQKGNVQPSGMQRGQAVGYLFVLPWIVGLVSFVIGPVVVAFILSFTDWNMIKAPHWVGMQHYLEMPVDSKFLIGIKTTFLYAFFAIPISLIGGITTAGMLVGLKRGGGFFRAMIYFPALFTGAEVAVLWVNMLNKDHGVLNAILAFFHVAPIDWMDANHAFFSVLMMNVFWVGGAMLIYYAGMKQIPRTLYEAADLDGASPARKFLQVTLPLLSPVILFMVVITTIGAFQVFTPALFFADSSINIGAPGDSLRFYAVNIYDKAFNSLEMGTACSYAIVLFVIIFVVTMIQLQLAKRVVYSDGNS